ncbi:hypothetical protein BJY01DRAFT_160825 [Aspergillus pseudoustus]|uniref:Up-regulated during septation-domain-containing protein n=1 Tax=Aspergillus pseudoustus TaxID=1810923 RepID=A0ABR4K760_9EURO
METRSARRKRCNSSASKAGQCSPIFHDKARHFNTRPCETPRHPHKRVRFSDPGPVAQNISTGLTPALCRTSFDEKEYNSTVQQTPSRRARRRSTPLPHSRRITDSQLPLGSQQVERVLHFTPLRQLLDTRTQRRIRRFGLSNEITNIEREKRATAQYEKSLDLLLCERDSLKRELESARRSKSSPESQTISDDGQWMTPEDRIKHLEYGNDRLRTQLSFSVSQAPHYQRSDSGSSVDTVILNDSGFEGETIFMSDSPDIRGADIQYSVPDNISLLSPKALGVDSSVQTLQPTRNLDPEIETLSRDLEVAKKEKRDLFEACRSHIDMLNGTPLERHLRQPSPPPEFLDDILPSLMQTLSRASDATHALNTIQDELSSLGFHGEDAAERIAELRNRFRTARLELERAVPGETADAGLTHGSSTLSALVKRVEALVKELGEERTRHHGSADRERALRGQFDILLLRYEDASNKIQGLEESIASSAGDMLHTRMRIQELECEAHDQVVGIDRLNAALSKYRDEVKSLENLIMRLENEKIQRAEKHAQQVSEFEEKAAGEEKDRRIADLAIAERERQIRELEEVVEQNRKRVCDLTAKVEMIERERDQEIESLKQSTGEQALEHEQEIGLLNVRVSELNTALDTAREEAEKLRLSNIGLEEQLRLEIDSKDGLLDQWVAEQTRSYTAMKTMVNAERRKAKVRAANWELKSDELQSDALGMGSEPITPVSMTRFVDVEVGRGKHRRRLDSGVGIPMEDEDEDEDTDQQLLPSDPVDL